MRGRTVEAGTICQRVWSAWLILSTPAFGASFSGVALDDLGKPVSGAMVSWRNQGVCVATDPYHAPRCYPPTVVGSTTTASDGSFVASNLPGDTYYLCLYPISANQLASCDWTGFGETGPVWITLTANQDLNGLKLIVRSGSLVVITVKDPMNAISRSFFSPAVIVGTGGYYHANYAPDRGAYTLLMPKGVPARVFFDTLLLVQDAEGNNLPIDTPTLPFTSSGDETHLSITVTLALVNAASYIPGIAQGAIATLFGSGFTDVPGVQQATSFPLPTQLSGTSVTVNGVAAPLLAVVDQNGQDQINFQVPHFPILLSFPRLVIVVNNNGKTQTIYSKEWDDLLGIFSALGHLTGDPITATNPAQPGEQIVIYWTGLSGYNFVFSQDKGIFFIPDGIPSPPSIPCVGYLNPQVQIAGRAAEVNSCSATPGIVGVGQLVVTVPPDLQSGNYDVMVTMDTYVKGNVVQLLVQHP